MAVKPDRCHEIKVQVVDLNQARNGAGNEAGISKLPVSEPGLDPVFGRC